MNAEIPNDQPSDPLNDFTGELPDLSDGGSFVSEGETQRLLELDLRGADGQRGRDGESYFERANHAGQAGRRGGDATHAQRGSDAASARVRLTYAERSPNATSLRIEAEDLIPNRHRIEPFCDERRICDDGYVFIYAVGGRGGDGGRGGNGQPGGHGYPGRDATRFSNGTDGGPGGDGGDAGNPTDGERGGDGGEISLVVAYDSQGLLMLVKGSLSGGDIGFAGDGGIGGDGGSGGPGGSSYHWTETEHYTDSQGKRQSRTIFHSNPGGSSGRPGRTGSPSLYQARDGQPGSPGRLRIIVNHRDGTSREYAAPYDLELVSLDIAGEYTVLEPDSLVSIDNLVVRNIGGMPTPPGYEIRIKLAPDDWVLVDQVDMVLTRSLAPGESYTFSDDGLGFRLGDEVVDHPRRQPFHLSHPINPLAFLESGIHRQFRNFECVETIEARFPVELTDIIALNSLAPGESTRVRWGITNTSSETFDDKLTYRSLRTGGRLLGGNLDENQIVFYDDTDQPHDLLREEYQVAVRNLAPGQTHWIETRIGVRYHSDVVAYQDVVLGIDLLCQRPKSSARNKEYRCVDYRQETIRISERYRRDENSRFLLIANQKTDVDQIEKWTQLADYFGSGLDVWDVSYYGFLDFVRQLDQPPESTGVSQEPPSTLLQQWRGMTVIVPNNYFHTPAGKTTAFEQLAKSQFLKAAADYDINFYIVGDSRTGGEQLLQSSLIPISDQSTPNQRQSQRDFLKQVRRWSKYVARSGEVVGGASKDISTFADAALGEAHEFQIDRRTILFQPDAKWLEREAQNLQRKLIKSDPLHRWVIVHRYDTGDTDTSWGFFRKRQVGRLEARRTLDSSKGSAVLYEVDSIDIIDEDFINSEENKHGIFLALKFEDKVDRFIRLVSERVFPRASENYIDRPLSEAEIEQIGHQLIDSILVDIYNEQRVARTCRTWGASGVRPLLPKLNYLAERSLNYGLTFRQMEAGTVPLDLLYELLASIQYIARQSRTIWDSPVFPTALFKRSRAVSAHMLERVDRIMTNIFGRRLSWWDKWSGANDDYDPFGNAKNKIPKGLARDTAVERTREVEADLLRRKVPLESFTRAQSHKGLTYDPELLSESARVLPGHVYDQFVRTEREADLRRATMEYAVAKQRSELLVPLETTTGAPQVTVTQQPTVTPQPTVTRGPQQ